VEEEEPTPEEMPNNELTSTIEVHNTDHHKAIIKARNKYYQDYKSRFQLSVSSIITKYDELRKEEHRFTAYWNQNLNEITKKHI
jgi:hypothetical protein